MSSNCVELINRMIDVHYTQHNSVVSYMYVDHVFFNNLLHDIRWQHLPPFLKEEDKIVFYSSNGAVNIINTYAKDSFLFFAGDEKEYLDHVGDKMLLGEQL